MDAKAPIKHVEVVEPTTTVVVKEDKKKFIKGFSPEERVVPPLTDLEQETQDAFDGPIWKDQHGDINYPQPGRANPNDAETGVPGHPDNPIEEVIPEYKKAATKK
jgi:hypothetical protein